MTFSPVECDLEADKKYFWCTCGLSSKDPHCDGAHKGTGKKSMHFAVNEEAKAWLCMCKKTKNPPYCDGSHNKD